MASATNGEAEAAEEGKVLKVEIAGMHVGWDKRIELQLNESSGCYETKVELPIGKFVYKARAPYLHCSPYHHRRRERQISQARAEIAELTTHNRAGAVCGKRRPLGGGRGESNGGGRRQPEQRGGGDGGPGGPGGGGAPRPPHGPWGGLHPRGEANHARHVEGARGRVDLVKPSLVVSRSSARRPKA
eukprot:6215944-Pyramimonas_sp.AAC.1